MFLPRATSLPSIDAASVRLRALRQGDAEALFRIFGDATVCRYWSSPPLADLRAAEALQREIDEGFASRSLFQWGIVEVVNDRVVGTCTLASLSEAHERAAIGFALAREAWGRGYVTEALPALLDFGFEVLGLHRIEADVDPRNERSIRLLERTGFMREGYQRERHLMQGERQDALLYGLLRPEWRARDARMQAR